MIPALANHLLQSTIFAVVAGMLTLLLRHNHARTRYWAWFVASMKFLIPFSLFVEIGHRLSWSSAPVITEPRLAFVMDEISQPFVAPEGYAPAPVHAVVSAPSIVPALLLAIWICGCAAVLIFWLVRWRRVTGILSTALPAANSRELCSLRRLERIAGVSRQTRLVSSETEMEPGVFGILRPVLSLPAGITEHLDDEQLDAILAHELCHVRRRDNLTAAFHMLVEAVFWFHPMVWWIGARLVEERERACDEEVVGLGSDPEVYAESILRICRFYLASPLVCAAGISGSDLGKRIESIMTSPLASSLGAGKRLILGAAALLALIIPITMGIFAVPAIHAQLQRPVMVAQAVPQPPPPPPPPPARRSPPAAVTEAPTAAAPRLEFEAASVRPVGSGLGRGPMRGGPGTDDPERFSWESAFLRSLLMKAYGIRIDQISGPAWLDSEKYTIAVKIPPGTTKDQFQVMLQNLLIDRFRMTVHHETREFPAWELVVAKGGPKIKDSFLAPNAATRREMRMGDGQNLPVDRDGFLQLGDLKGIVSRESNGSSFETYQSATMASFVQFLSTRMGSSIAPNRFASAIVVDKTGLTGEYDFTFEFSQDSAPMPRFSSRNPDDPAAEPDGPPRGTDFFVALEKQLGLKLQKTSTMADVLVIDHAEKVPTEN